MPQIVDIRPRLSRTACPPPADPPLDVLRILADAFCAPGLWPEARVEALLDRIEVRP